MSYLFKKNLKHSQNSKNTYSRRIFWHKTGVEAVKKPQIHYEINLIKVTFLQSQKRVIWPVINKIV